MKNTRAILISRSTFESSRTDSGQTDAFRFLAPFRRMSRLGRLLSRRVGIIALVRFRERNSRGNNVACLATIGVHFKLTIP